MTLFESGYKAAAKTELERKIREREDKDKVAQTRTDFSDNTGGTQSNIAFAQRFTEEKQARREEQVKATIHQNQFMCNEIEKRTDDFENPRERAERYFNMDSVNAEISRERAKAEADRADYESAASSKCFPLSWEREK